MRKGVVVTFNSGSTKKAQGMMDEGPAVLDRFMLFCTTILIAQIVTKINLRIF